MFANDRPVFLKLFVKDGSFRSIFLLSTVVVEIPSQGDYGLKYEYLYNM